MSPPTFAEALRFWCKLGFISFGGPGGQIAIMHAECVERRRWVDEGQFLHALNFCMLLPGPEATQLAIYLGWLLHGVRGGLAAGTLFVLPAVGVLWALSWLYMAGGHLPGLAAVFDGLKPAVLAIVAAAVWRLGTKALKTPDRWALAGVAFVAIYFFKVPFPVVVAAAGAWGFWRFKVGMPLRGVRDASTSVGESVSDTASRTGGQSQGRLGEASLPGALVSDAALRMGGQRRGRLGEGSPPRTLALGLALWLGPTLLAIGALGWDSTLARMGRFFSGAALATFGGAYAVLPYVGQRAVETYGWLEPGQMLDGLGLAETTPGPLIMVLQFVGFVGAWRHPDAGMPPLLAGTLGALLTTWATFAPSFGFIFLGAPYVERLRENARLNAALGAITAAVVGVILNLAVWFGSNVLFPAGGRLDPFALATALGALAALTWGKRGVITVVLACAVLGWLRWRLSGG